MRGAVHVRGAGTHLDEDVCRQLECAGQAEIGSVNLGISDVQTVGIYSRRNNFRF